MKRFECDGMLLPVWPKGKKWTSGQYWKADPVKAPKAGPEPIWSFTPKPDDAPSDWATGGRLLRDNFDRYGCDETGIHWSACRKGKCTDRCERCTVASRRQMRRAYLYSVTDKTEPDFHVADDFRTHREQIARRWKQRKPVVNAFRAACLKPFTDAVEASGRATHAEPIAAKRQSVPDTAAMDAFIDSMPALTPAVLAEVVKPAIVEPPKPTRKPVPQLPSMPGMAPLGISPEKFKAPVPVVTVPVQTVPTVTEPAKPATKRDRMRAMAEDKETKSESKAIPLALPELADLRTEYKRLKAIADAANADLDVIKAKLCTEIEPHRIKACRDMGECRTSVSCDGTTFTSRHNWQSPMNKAELAIFEQACAAQGVDAMKYVDSTYTVETSGGVLADDVASLVCQHATRLQVELPPECPDSVLDALQSAGIKLQVVHKSARVLHEDYTMKAAVENAVRACAAVKAVQPVLYFSK